MFLREEVVEAFQGIVIYIPNKYFNIVGGGIVIWIVLERKPNKGNWSHRSTVSTPAKTSELRQFVIQISIKVSVLSAMRIRILIIFSHPFNWTISKKSIFIESFPNTSIFTSPINAICRFLEVTYSSNSSKKFRKTFNVPDGGR